MIVYSRTALAQDTDGNLTKLTTTGANQDEVKTTDLYNRELLEQILQEMKKTNFHLSVLTENFVEEI